MTYGQIRFRLTKAFPGVDADLLEGWINDAYAEILQELPWQRLTANAVLQTVAPYSTGTVSVTNGSTAVSLTDGTFTTGMTGRAFRVDSRSEWYEFSYLSASTGQLDRAYEGTSGSALAYKLYQSIYSMPADCRFLADDAFTNFTLGPLERFSRGGLNAAFPSRLTYGTPQAWADYMDDGSTPPQIQVELYPIPDAAIGIPFSYVTEQGPFTSASTLVLPWIQPAAMIEATTAKIKRHLKDYVGAAEHQKAAEAALSKMRDVESHRTGAMRMELVSHYTAHRRARWR